MKELNSVISLTTRFADHRQQLGKLCYKDTCFFAGVSLTRQIQDIEKKFVKRERTYMSQFDSRPHLWNSMNDIQKLPL